MPTHDPRLTRRPRGAVPTLRVSALALSAMLVLGALFAGPVAAATTTVECGQLSAYTPPDPVGPTDGSLTLGLLAPYVVAADATLSSAVAANLAGNVSSGPTCLTIARDGADRITALDFAAAGDVSGAVVFDAGFGGYIFANRVLIPTFITDAYPGLAAIFPTSLAAGTHPTVTFLVATATGRVTGVDARGAFCGQGSVAGNGDGVVGAAIIPAVVVDPASSSALAGAGSRNACAAVRTQGTLDQETGQLDLTTTVTITLAAPAPTPPAPTPPNTSSANAAARASSGLAPWLPPLFSLLSLLVASVAWAPRPLRELQRFRDR